MYQDTIRQELARLGRPDVDPRHVEAFMRLQYGTLDHLSRAEFRRETAIGVGCVDEGGEDGAESLAASYGL